jgi:hypothetical protein
MRVDTPRRLSTYLRKSAIPTRSFTPTSPNYSWTRATFVADSSG